MLHRATSTALWRPDRGSSWQRNLRSGLNSTLARYLLILAALCALGCAYLWQASDLSELYSEAIRLEWQANRLEVENMRLVEQSARWNAPSYIEQRMQEEGFTDAQAVVHTRLPLNPNSAGQPTSAAPTLQLVQSSSSQ